MKLYDLLEKAVQKNASDLHLVVGIPPSLRMNGAITLMEYDKLSPEDTEQLIYEVLNEDQKIKFEKDKELNISFSLPKISHFRMNIYRERGYVEAAIRIIPFKIPSLKELGLPRIVEDLTRKPNGIVLITGPAGMGKTTTMAAMIDLVNRDERRYRIITIEDPIEYVHSHINSIVVQREVGNDTNSFSEALRQALRQDPNLICIGEMRDLETIETALTAAETGHLVFATLHTSDAVMTIDRIAHVFPPYQQERVRIQLAATIQGVISQRLLPRADGRGRVLALEIMLANEAVRSLIRSDKTVQLNTVISTSSALGMIELDKCLESLYGKGIITYDTAMSYAKRPLDFFTHKSEP